MTPGRSSSDILPLIAEAHAPGKCVSVEDANRVLAEERAGVQRLIADAEKRAAAAALREAARHGRQGRRPIHH
jgi:hypothetical protein